MNKYLVYGLAAPHIPDLVMYVGRSSSGLRRPRSHMSPSCLRRGTTPKDHWLRDLAAQGRRPVIVVLENVSDADALAHAEPRWIVKIRAENPGLLNVDSGGYPGPQSQAHKDAISRTHKANGHRPTREAIALAVAGRDEAWCLNMAKVKGARPFRDQHGNVYQSIQGAARILGLSPGNIHRVLHPGKYHYRSTRGYIFTFV